MVLPFTVGVTPGVSEDIVDEGEVSGPEEELVEPFMALMPTSFLDIAWARPEFSLEGCIEELLDSVEIRESMSSLNRES